MRVTVLGSSGGYPAPGSACSGYLFEAGDTRAWVDAGSGTLSRLLGLCSLADLTGAVVTHLHADHWTDLPLAIHTLRFAFERDGPLPVYGPEGWVLAMGIVDEWAKEEPPVFVARELLEHEVFAIGGLSIEPIRVEHSLPDTFGLRMNDGATTVAYTADTGACEALDELARDADLLICEAGAPEEPAETHMTARQAGELAMRAGAGRLVLTHLAPRADPRRALADASGAFPGPVELAVEGLSLDL